MNNIDLTPTCLRFHVMSLSTESIVAIIAVIASLPPSILILWKLYQRANATHTNPLGTLKLLLLSRYVRHAKQI